MAHPIPPARLALGAVVLAVALTACRKTPRQPPRPTPPALAPASDATIVDSDAPAPALAPAPDAAPADAEPAHSLQEVLDRIEPCTPDPRRARGRFVHVVLSPAHDQVTVGAVFVNSGDRAFDACAERAALGAVLPGEFHPNETLEIRVAIER